MVLLEACQVRLGDVSIQAMQMPAVFCSDQIEARACYTENPEAVVIFSDKNFSVWGEM